MDVDMSDARAEAADVIALDDASMAVEPDDDATPGSLLHGAQIVATDVDDHERPASPADASAAPAEDPVAMDGSEDDDALDDVAPDSPHSDENLDDIDGDTASEDSEDDRAASGEGASGPTEGDAEDAEEDEEDEEDEGAAAAADEQPSVDVDDALAELTLAQRQELVELAKCVTREDSRLTPD
mmetsp:Transcript_4070/g.15097  ORF Transcript_4070/g.15097 Transcript_4070/m.15097 type:complete len:184 (-) Transcript_4070:288-839(-)